MSTPLFVNARAMGKKHTGVERYTAEIANQLNDKIQILHPQKPFSGAAGHLWEQLFLPMRIPRRGVLWSPANSGPLRVGNQVLTLHDISVLEHPEWFSPVFAAWYKFLLPRLVKRVRKIVTVSDYSKDRIRLRFQVPGDQIIVISNGVDQHHFRPRVRKEIRHVRKKYRLEREYVLTVCTWQPRKNLHNLLSAWQQVSIRFPQLELIIVGRKGKVYRNQAYIPLPVNVRWLVAVSDNDLPALFSGAFACVQPSLYEGFNLPVLEAMACGTPVLAANTTATPGLVSDAGMLFDPRNVEDMVVNLEAVFEDDSLRSKMREWGQERASHYSWERTAEKMLLVLNSSR